MTLVSILIALSVITCYMRMPAEIKLSQFLKKCLLIKEFFIKNVFIKHVCDDGESEFISKHIKFKTIKKENLDKNFILRLAVLLKFKIVLCFHNLVNCLCL